MDFDDCPPPLPPPVVEEETNAVGPDEEPPMTTIDGSGADAWIMRGLEVMRSKAANESHATGAPVNSDSTGAVSATEAVEEKNTHTDPEDVVEVVPAAPAADDAIPSAPLQPSGDSPVMDLIPPPIPSDDVEAEPAVKEELLAAQEDGDFSQSAANDDTALFGVETVASDDVPVAFVEEVTPGHQVPPVLSQEEAERRQQENLIADEEEQPPITVAARRLSTISADHCPPRTNDAVFDTVDTEEGVAGVGCVTAVEEETAAPQEEAEDEADAGVPAVFAYEEPIAGTVDPTSDSTNVIDEAIAVVAAEVAELTHANDYVAAEDNVETITDADGPTPITFSPQNTVIDATVVMSDRDPVIVDTGRTATADVASPAFASPVTALSDDTVHVVEADSPNERYTEFPTADKFAAVAARDAPAEERDQYQQDQYRQEEQQYVEARLSNARAAQRRVQHEESDVDDDRKYDCLPAGDRVVRHSEFDAFASRAVELIQNLQEQKDAEVSTLNENLALLHQQTREDTAEAVTAAQQATEAKLRQDYMNHIGALQQYLDSKVSDVIERGDKFVLDNVEALKQHVAFEIQSAENREEVRLLAQADKYKAKMSRLNEKMAHMQAAMDVMQEALQRAMDLEQFPEPREIPQGKKIRLQVRLEVTNIKPVPIILVPISENANVADLKHEAIRRARRQGTIGDNVVYSNTAIHYENLTLFDDDDFVDIGIERGDLTVSLIFTGAEATVQRIFENNAASGPQSGVISTVAPPTSSSPMFSSTGLMHQPPPPMPPAPTSTTHVASSSSSGAMPPPPPMMANFPTAPNRPNLTASKDIITGYFLREELSKEINDHEGLERRLMHELERMERDPLKTQESMCRIRLAKDAINRMRSNLLDKATYCYQEAHRAAARATLTTIQNVMDNPSASVDDFIRAANEAQRVVDGLSTNAGEQGRIDALEEAAARNQAKKDRMKDDLEELGYELRNKIRVDYEMMPMAERLLDQIDRCSILAASMTLEELDEVHSRVVAFITSCKAKMRA